MNSPSKFESRTEYEISKSNTDEVIKFDVEDLTFQTIRDASESIADNFNTLFLNRYQDQKETDKSLSSNAPTESRFNASFWKSKYSVIVFDGHQHTSGSSLASTKKEAGNKLWNSITNIITNTYFLFIDQILK